VPSWRATKDISIKEDLVEEVGRMVGYDSIPPSAPLAAVRVPPANPERLFHQRVREMAAAQGFTEVHNYSFMNEEMALAFSYDLAAHLRVANPIASDQTLLRSSLLPGIRKNLNDNARNFDSFRLFEIGREIHRDRESPHFVAAIFAKDDGVASLSELKRLSECLLSGVSVRPAGETRPYEHPRRAADVRSGETVVGRLFEFHPRMIEGGRAAVLDLDLTLLQQLQSDAIRYRPIRRFPDSAFDLSVVAGPRVLIADVQGALEKLAGASLLEIVFLRDYALPTGDRSLSYRLTVGAADRTLSAEEVAAVRARVIEGMQAAGYDLRV
jgi:phenylalanyl-tRNA synthetase beta chain